jgi:tetratricopeptide (TPR) repeat protein
VAKVFLSYKHETTDSALVRRLAEDLAQGRHEVFFDRVIPPGVRFAVYIEQRLRECDVFVVLVTKAAHESEWIRTELSIANEIARQGNGRPRVIGLILEKFPWDIEWRVYLDKWQHVSCLDPAKDWDQAIASIRRELNTLDHSAGAGGGALPLPVEPASGPQLLSEVFLKPLERLLDVAQEALASRRFQQALEVLQSCEAFAEQPAGLAPAELRIRLYNDFALAFASLRKTEDAQAYLGKAGHLLAAHDLPALRAVYEHRVSYIHLQKREIYDALKHLEVAEALARDHKRTGLLGQVQDMLGTAWSALGVLDLALENFQNSLTTKEAAGDRVGQAITHGNLGRAFQRIGDIWRARQHFEKDLELSRQLRDYDGVMLMRSHLAGLLREELRFAESLRAYEEYLRLARDQEMPQHVAFAHLGMAQVRLALGQLDEAEKDLRDAGAFDAAWFRPFLLRVQAELAARGKEPARALHLYHRAVEEFEKSGGQPQDLVETLCQLARLCVREAREDEARAALQHAQDLARQQRMRWLMGRLRGLEIQLLQHKGLSYQREALPFPVALRAARVDAAIGAAERADELLELFKVMLKYSTSIALAEYIAVAADLRRAELDKLIIDAFDRGKPSAGHWAQVLRTLILALQPLRERLYAPELVGSFVECRGPRARLREQPQKCIDRFLEVRNQFSHLRRPGGDEQQQIVQELDTLLAPWMDVLEPLWTYRLCACQVVDAGARWRELTGSASLVHWPVCAGLKRADAEDGEVVLWRPDRPAGLHISPLWLARWRDDSEARGELLVFSKRAHQQGVYIDIESRNLHKLPGKRVRLSAIPPESEEES